MNANKKYTKWVALSMVIANMIGAGVFISLGFQVVPAGIPDAGAILIVWLLGGVISLCGAFAYTEMATTFKRSGGEYVFLSKLYHPLIGFLSGWASLFIGFAAAIATSAIVIGKYSAPVFGIDTEEGYLIGDLFIANYKLTSVLAVIVLSLVHIKGVRTGGIVQNILTAIKIGLIAVFIFAPLTMPGFEPSSVDFSITSDSWDIIYSLPFAGSLVWVMYAYSGWNASSYIAGNVEDPKRSLPFSLILGTAIVTIVYVLLNAMFMYSAEFSELAYVEDIGNVVAINLFGDSIGLLFSGVFSLAMISTMSAMIIAGPRVMEQIGNDYVVFKKLSVKSEGGTPTYSILLQALIAIVFVVISTFQNLIETIGFVLFLFSLLTVVGVFILRYKNIKGKISPEEQEGVVRTWGYPVTPIIFILATLWMIYYFVAQDPVKLLYALILFVPAVIIYYVVEQKLK